MSSPRYPFWLAASGALLLASASAAPTPSDTITVGAASNSYPYSFQGSDGRMQGFCVELFDLAAAQAHLKVQRIPAPSLDVNRRFEAGEFDCMQQYTAMPERQAFTEFTSPVLINPICIITARDSGITRPEDLQGRRIVYVTKKFPGSEFLTDHHLAAQWRQASRPGEGLRWLATGQADAFFLGRFTALPLIAHLGLRNLVVAPISASRYTAEQCFAVHRGNAELLARLDGGLLAIERSGQYARVWDKWFGPYQSRQLNRDDVLTWGAILLSAAFVAALWALLRQRSLHAELAERSREVSGQRALLQALYDHIPVGMTVLELGGEEPRVLSMNREAVRLYGADSNEHLREAARRFVAGGSLAQYDWVYPKTRRIFSVTLVPLRTAPQAPARLCVLAEDITARRQADAEIAQSRKMRAVGELVGGIAHEFNNLLTPVLLKVGELSVLHAQQSELVRDLEVIADAARRGADLTRRLLTFGRKNESQNESVRLTSVVDACFHLLRSTVDRRIAWRNTVPADLPPLRGNGTDVNQLVINLLLNARDTLMEKIGRPHPAEWQPAIHVSGGQLPAGTYALRRPGPEGGTLLGWQHLAITDNGMGMPPEIAERIFEPFFTTKEVGQGTGLGLATAWHVVAEAGGRIELESVPNEGTTFHVYLPVWDTGPIAGLAALAPEPAADAAACRVLLVEDDPLVAQAMTTMLKRHRHRVRLTSDGSDAERIIRTDVAAIDLVIMDVNLPGIDGLELARRARLAGYAGRILATSGRVDSELRAALDSVGADGVLPKPFTVSQLESALRDCLLARAPA